ncbi:MAG TPA: glutathione S-transferase N-terminal domain-containing protein, partial [Burkholderiaceae bacterium]|nr:glutathione S-transferase N-terminal domain-containing protein [Burkholderiaceae bacterium]
MPELILHHYATSPFSEKVRFVLGHKGLAWRSVVVPMIMPKPDVVALTGGYRRTPFLQIGADVYCDSALMCRVLDRLQPQPPLYAHTDRGLADIVSQWADMALFWAAVPYTLQPAGFAYAFGNVPPEEIQALAADRAAMTAGMRRATLVDATAQLT